MGAGVGIRCDRHVVGIDIDTLSEEWAGTVRSIAEGVLGPSKPRVGRAPKLLLPYRCTEPLEYRQLRFSDGISERDPGLIECLAGETKWFVADGIHPKTLLPYSWPDGSPEFEQLTLVDTEKVACFFDEVERAVPFWRGGSSSTIDRERVDQAQLRGAPDQVRAAIEALPNNRRLFGYNDWIKVGIALRAALPDDERLALELFEDWTDKADISEPTEDAARVFHSSSPPFAVGAGYLYALAERHGDFDRSTIYFDVLGDLPATDEKAPTKAGFDFASRTRLHSNDLHEIADRQFVLGTRFQPGLLTLGVGPAGVSKSTFSILTALAIATGRPLTGEIVAKAGPVLLYNAEDPRDEIMRRIAAISRTHKLDETLVRERVFVLSGYDDLRLVFAERRERSGSVSIGEGLKDFLSFVRTEGVVHVALDPLIALHRGLEENSSSDMEALGTALRQFARRSGASVDLIHHTVKNRTANSEQYAGVADAARGSSAVVGLVRTAYTLQPMEANTGQDLGLPRERWGQMVRLDDAKANYGRRSARERWFEILSVLPNGEGVRAADFASLSPAVIGRANSSVGVHVAFDANRQRALAALSKAGEDDAQERQLRRFIVASMPAETTTRKDLTDRLVLELHIGETTARTRIDDAIPEGRANAAEVEADGWLVAVWREQRAIGRTRSWVIVKEALSQVSARQDNLSAELKIEEGIFA